MSRNQKAVTLDEVLDEELRDPEVARLYNYEMWHPVRRFSPGFEFHRTTCGEELVSVCITRQDVELSFRYKPNTNLCVLFSLWKYGWSE